MLKWYSSECFWGLNKTPSQNWDNGLDGWMVSRVWRKVSGKAAQPKEAGLFWCKFVCRQTRGSALTSQWNKKNPNRTCQNLNQVHFLDQFSEERQRGSNDVSLRTRWHVKAGWKSRMLRSKREKGTMDPSLDVSGWAASCERKADGEGCDNNQQMRQMMDSSTKEKGNMWY